jgi:hypothetical protein
MRRTQVLAALVGLVSFLALLAPAASAQTGYPPGPCTATTGTLDVGVVTVGQHFVVQVAPTCVFTVGASVTVTVNGVNIPGKVANANGFVLVDITVVSATQLSVDDPVITPAVCGVNTVKASGPSSTAQGGAATQTATFTLNCPAAAAAAAPSASTAASPIQSRLSLTGANTLRFVAIALALVGVGSMAVVATRRRRSSAF